MMIKAGYYVVFICSLVFANSIYAEEAIFAMGCFWSAETVFRDETTNKPLPGITALTVGYAGGTMKNPTYQNHPGYKEAIKVEYNPKILPYDKLLNLFWRNIDPFTASGQFCDQGPSYVAAIFYKNPQQQREADISKEQIQKKFTQKILTPILPVTTFYKAEDNHQNYQHKNSKSYSIYRYACGRDARIQEIWRK